MLSALTRIFTTKICPTCSKAVHRSKFDAHLRRHAAGLNGYRRYVVNVAFGTVDNAVPISILFRRWKAGRWAVVPTKEYAPTPENDPVLEEFVAKKLSELNADIPVFTKRPVPDPAPLVLAPAPNTLL